MDPAPAIIITVLWMHAGHVHPPLDFHYFELLYPSSGLGGSHADDVRVSVAVDIGAHHRTEIREKDFARLKGSVSIPKLTDINK
ncbi:MAG TPA: hypothetical protein VMU61_08620 [Candidatus Aquilonibacter sp.]|nr:hypothetical protein [Candidatus Aquilonibacter sp.]